MIEFKFIVRGKVRLKLDNFPLSGHRPSSYPLRLRASARDLSQTQTYTK